MTIKITTLTDLQHEMQLEREARRDMKTELRKEIALEMTPAAKQGLFWFGFIVLVSILMITTCVTCKAYWEN